MTTFLRLYNCAGFIHCSNVCKFSHFPCLPFHLASTQFFHFSILLLSKSSLSFPLPITRPHKMFSKFAENLFARVSLNLKITRKKLKFCTMETFTHKKLFFFASLLISSTLEKKVSLDSLFFFFEFVGRNFGSIFFLLAEIEGGF